MTDQGADVRIGPATCAGAVTGSAAEWLLTDGLGGYAMGTASGLRTRRYHGLLVVATEQGVPSIRPGTRRRRGGARLAGAGARLRARGPVVPLRPLPRGGRPRPAGRRGPVARRHLLRRPGPRPGARGAGLGGRARRPAAAGGADRGG